MDHDPQRQVALQQAWSKASDKAFSAYARATGGEGVLKIEARLLKIAPGLATATTIGATLER